MMWTLDPKIVGPAIAGMILPKRYSSSVEYSADIETYLFLCLNYLWHYIRDVIYGICIEKGYVVIYELCKIECLHKLHWK